MYSLRKTMKTALINNLKKTLAHKSYGEIRKQCIEKDTSLMYIYVDHFKMSSKLFRRITFRVVFSIRHQSLIQ